MTPELPAVAGLVAALVVALVATPLARALAPRLGLVARPVLDRWHQQPTALMGGVAIAVAAASGLGVALLVGGVDSAAVRPGSVMAGTVGAAGTFMLLVGLADDGLHLRPQLKFLLQLLAAAGLVMAGVVIRLTPWYVVNVLVTVFWFVGVTNAFNLLDNMDGVAAGVACIAALFLGIALLREGAWIRASLAWSLAGASLGFLRFNFHPASIFMGDAGSLFIGSVLAGLVAASPQPTSGSLVSVLFVPVAIVAVPIVDTTLVTVTRLLSGRAISQGGRDHSTHRLVALGLSERGVAWLLYAFAAAGGLIALALTALDRDAAIIVGTVFLVALALWAAYLGRLHVEHADEARGTRPVTILVTRLLYKRSLAKMLLDLVLLSLSYYAAYGLRFDGAPPPQYADAFRETLGIFVPLKLIIFVLFGVYRGPWQYAGVVDLYRVAGAVLASSLALLSLGHALYPPLAQSHSILYIDALCTGALVLASRLSFRSLDLAHKLLQADGERVLIYGAGDGGELALRELRNNQDRRMVPVCILDDDVLKHGQHLHGVPVVGGREQLEWALERYGARTVVLATRKLPPVVMEELRAFSERHGVTLVEWGVRLRRLGSSGEHAAPHPSASCQPPAADGLVPGRVAPLRAREPRTSGPKVHN